MLYIGVTSNLVRRVYEHKYKLIPGFTSRYNLTRLAYFETFVYPDAAIAREKELTGCVAGKLNSSRASTRNGTTWRRGSTTSTNQQQGKISPRQILRSA